VDLERLIATLGPTEVLHPAAADVADLAHDARLVEPGALFFCVPGQRFDGHDLAGEAVANGAVALVVERPVDVDLPQLVVADARTAMARAAAEFFGHPSHELTVAGVTGTNGKTTTSFLLFAMLAAAGRRPGLLGTVETRVGGERRPAVRTTPEAIDLQRVLREMLDAGDRSCALEATSHGSALKRLLGCRFAVLAFTNLSQDHLDLHGTMEAYYDAKRRLFVADDPPPAVVNVDNPYGRRLAAELQALDVAPILTFAVDAHADLRPEGLEIGANGAKMRIGGIDVVSPLLGRFNVENVLAAVGSAMMLGLPDDAIARGVASVRGVPGRFEPVDEGQPFLVVVDYAHTPDSLSRALLAARGLAEGRVICVFGCGGDRDRAKRPLMGRAAETGSDVAIVTSDNPRSEDPRAIIAEVLEGVHGEMAVEPDRAAAIARAVELAEPGDLVLIAGKGHEQGQEGGGRTVPFDDRDVARDALRRLGART
jgi:UDP-N-acetylmuramoyl-L-alanyl-D-glutamate--2,6-diaminopimelate ligase